MDGDPVSELGYLLLFEKKVDVWENTIPHWDHFEDGMCGFRT